MNKVPMQLLVDTKEHEATLTIYGDVTSLVWDEADTSSVDVAKALSELPASVSDVRVRINSYGGEVKEGLAIYNALKSSGKRVTTVCDGFACSIASVIFAAGERRIMSNASALMIHNPWTYTMGNPDQLRKEADDLEKIAQLSRAVYGEITALTEDEIKALMDEETWITPEEALDMGFATETEREDVTEPTQAVASSVIQKLCAKDAQVATVVATLSQEQIDEIVNRVREIAECMVNPADDAAALVDEEVETADVLKDSTPSESFFQKLKRITTTE